MSSPTTPISLSPFSEIPIAFVDSLYSAFSYKCIEGTPFFCLMGCCPMHKSQNKANHILKKYIESPDVITWGRHITHAFSGQDCVTLI